MFLDSVEVKIIQLLIKKLEKMLQIKNVAICTDGLLELEFSCVCTII